MTQTFALILFLTPLAWSPGPGNLFFAALGARFGLRGTGPALAGYHAATLAVTAAVGLGLSVAVTGMPVLQTALRIAGAGYVLWLAGRFLRAGRGVAGAEAQPATALDGALLLVLNPKAWVIIALMFSQFLPPDAPVTTVLWITAVFTANNLAAFAGWSLAGDALGRAFRDPAMSRWLNTAFGVMLAGVALWLALG